MTILIGHDPRFEELLAHLTGEDRRRMPTCAWRRSISSRELEGDEEDQGASSGSNTEAVGRGVKPVIDRLRTLRMRLFSGFADGY